MSQGIGLNQPISSAARVRLRVAGTLLGLVARLWLFTLRWKVLTTPDLHRDCPQPWVLVFWHGEQFALLAWPRRRATAVLVSHSRDGEIQTHALRQLGLVVERGSSARGGPSGLLAITRRLRTGRFDAAFAVDGPRGPRHEVSPGAITASNQACALLVPMGSACDRSHTFRRSWDQFRLPVPFSRTVIALGPLLDPREAGEADLARAIHAACDRAQKAL